MKKLLMFITFMFVLCACAPQNEQAFLTSRSAASVGNAPSRWPASAFPINLKISSDFNLDENDAIKNMANQWSLSTNNNLIFFETTDTTSEKGQININNYNDNVMAVYKLNKWPLDFPQTALAVTQVFGTKVNIGTSGEYIKIDHADIMINYENFDFSTDYGFGYDFQTVVLHEMGHFLGLYHDSSSSAESIMYPSISRFVDNREPKSKDILNLSSLYGLSYKSSAINKYFIPEQKLDEVGPSEPVVIIYEMFPNGKEKSYIKKIDSLRGSEKK